LALATTGASATWAGTTSAGGVAAGSVPPRSASALYFALVRSPASDSATFCCSSGVVAAGLSGTLARSGVAVLSAGSSAPNQVVGSTQSGTLGKLEQPEAPRARSATAATPISFILRTPSVMECS